MAKLIGGPYDGDNRVEHINLCVGDSILIDGTYFYHCNKRSNEAEYSLLSSGYKGRIYRQLRYMTYGKYRKLRYKLYLKLNEEYGEKCNCD